VFIREIRGYLPDVRLISEICGDVLWLMADCWCCLLIVDR